MSRHPWLALAGWFLRRKNPHRSQRDSNQPRILVIRRNRMGDMICTLPLLHALRRHFPQAHLAVACDTPGEPIASACGAVNQTILLQSGGFRPLTLYKNARLIQGFDWVIAAKGGFDRRLAALAMLSHAAVSIGFEERNNSSYYTDPVAFPTDPREHQVETLLRLLAPLGISAPTPLQFDLNLPPAARDFATAQLSTPPFATAPRFLLINLSSTSPIRFRAEDFLELATKALAATDWAIAFVAAPADQSRARELAARASSDRVTAIATPGPLELAALLERATVFVTPEGGAAHLAATTGTPAVVLWSEGPFEKWHSRSEKHIFIQPQPGEKIFSVDRIWHAVESLTGNEKKTG